MSNKISRSSPKCLDEGDAGLIALYAANVAPLKVSASAATKSSDPSP